MKELFLHVSLSMRALLILLCVFHVMYLDVHFELIHMAISNT